MHALLVLLLAKCSVLFPHQLISVGSWLLFVSFSLQVLIERTSLSIIEQYWRKKRVKHTDAITNVSAGKARHDLFGKNCSLSQFASYNSKTETKWVTLKSRSHKTLCLARSPSCV